MPGYWDGDKFVFEPPIEIFDNGEFRKIHIIDFSGAEIAEGIFKGRHHRSYVKSGIRRED